MMAWMPSVPASRSGRPPAPPSVPSKAARIWVSAGRSMPPISPASSATSRLQQRLGLELEGEEDGRPAGGDGVAGDLERQGRLALALRPGKQAQRPGPEAAAEGVVEQREPGGQMPHRDSGDRNRASARSKIVASEVNFGSMVGLKQMEVGA